MKGTNTLLILSLDGVRPGLGAPLVFRPSSSLVAAR